MSVQIERRLQRLEEVAMPAPRVSTLIVAEPEPNASVAEREQFDRDVAAAHQAGQMVIVLVSLKPLVRLPPRVQELSNATGGSTWLKRNGWLEDDDDQS